jgi:hypothetical protein
MTPNPSPPPKTPPPMKRKTKKAKVGGKRKVQRKTYRRHK